MLRNAKSRSEVKLLAKTVISITLFCFSHNRFVAVRWTGCAEYYTVNKVNSYSRPLRTCNSQHTLLNYVFLKHAEFGL